VAASFLGSPKAYILLVTGALCAAGANVRYGWDFNGILVPALLGLAIFKPIEFGATFVETVLLYFTVLALIRLTPLKRANIEGPRRTVLFFCVDYGLRFGFAALLGSHVPGEDIVSYTGFGYLLPTLMAVKISQKASVPLIVLPTLGVSATGFVAGTLIGYAATLFDVATESPSDFSRVMPPAPHDPAAAALWASALSVDGVSGSDFGLAFALSKPWDLLDGATNGHIEVARRAGFATDRLDGGVILLRERFETAGTKRGLPTYLYRPSPSHAEPVVVLVSDPRRDAACVTAAATMVATGVADVAVIAGIARPSDPWLETGAHSTARTLAEGGLLVLLSGSAEDKSVSRPAAPDVAARADATIRKIRATLHAPGAAAESLVKSALVQERELRVTLDSTGWASSIAPTPVEVPLESSTAIAIAMDGVRASSVTVNLEHIVALRRLVLEPLLAPTGAPEAAASRALVPFAATMLGYSLTAPTKGPDGQEFVALLPHDQGLPIALVTRASGVKSRVVEAPMAARRGVRDLALRLFVAVDADAIFLGEAWSGGMRYGAMREAQAAVTDRATPEILFVRGNESDTTQKGLELASWMDDGRASAEAVAAATKLGLTVERRDLDAPTREIATRTLLRMSPLVSIVAGTVAERFASLDVARRAKRRFSELGLKTLDGSIEDAARTVDRELGASGATASQEFGETARRAAAEESVVAANHLGRDIAAGAAHAALVRTAEGTFLIAVARTTAGRELVSVSVDPRSGWEVASRPWADCLAAPLRAGICSEAAP
jgi:hypothetical protein